MSTSVALWALKSDIGIDILEFGTLTWGLLHIYSTLL